MISTEFFEFLYQPGDLLLVREIFKNGTPWSTYYRVGEKIPPVFREMSGNHQYFGVCPREGEGQNKASQIKRIRCLWADCDDISPFGLDRVLSKAALPIPSSVVATGGGAQVYWRLRVATEDTVELDAARSKLKEIARRIGDHVHDLARLMRIPGSKNVKYDPPRECCWIYRNDVCYNIDEFPDYENPTLYQGRTVRNVEIRPANHGGIQEELSRLAEKAFGAKRGERSEAEFRLVCAAIRLGVGRDELWEFVRDHGKFAERGIDYFHLTWEKANERVSV